MTMMTDKLVAKIVSGLRQIQLTYKKEMQKPQIFV